MYYIKYFFLTSILGFLLENLLTKNYESGILYGPWTPVYGIGTIIMLLVSNKIFKKKISKIKKFIILIISCTLLLTLTELVGGLLIEKIFNITYWDYTKYKYNIYKYICLEMSLMWMISSIIFIYVLKPVLDVIIKKIPNIIIYLITPIFIIDIMLKIIFRN